MKSKGRLLASALAGGRLFRLTLWAFDATAIAAATLLAYYTRFDGVIPVEFAGGIPWAIAGGLLVYSALFASFGLYRLVLRFVSIDTMVRLALAVLLGFVALVAADLVVPAAGGLRTIPFGVLFIQALLVLFASAGIRVATRVGVILRASQVHADRHVLIVGAGSAGSLLLREIQNRPDLALQAVGFLDDDRNLLGRTIGGVRVIGTTAEIGAVVKGHRIDEILVAIPSARAETVRRILNAAADAGVQTRVMPSLVIAKGSVSLRDLRKVDVEDLLGREPTPTDIEQVAETLSGKVVAVTGAAGSIGSELCRQIMGLKPARLLLLEIDETRLYELWLELGQTDPDVPVMCVCDIRDAARLDCLFELHHPHVVLHAAAYKHVPLMELAPDEAVKTNVLGTANVIGACQRHAAERFVLISTDKAVAPVNMMGLTKSLAEKLMLAAGRSTSLLTVAVRFGNVLGSRGSVVPIFENQLRHGGPLTVTDAEVTRYFMTIPEAARLVLQAQAIGRSGDILVLEMGDPVRIVDLARKMIALSGIPADIEFIGLRPGEKLHEALIHEHERLEPTGREKINRVASLGRTESERDIDIDALVESAAEGDSDSIAEAIVKLDPEFADRQCSGG